MRAKGTTKLRVLVSLVVLALVATGDRHAFGETGGLPRPAIVAPGKVEPLSEEMKMAAAITGRLAEVRVEEGQRVVAGEVLAVIENAEQLARLHQAEAAVRLKQATLDRVVNGPRPAERREVRAAVTAAEATLAQAEAELIRQQSLATAGNASRQALDAARRDRDVARAGLAEANSHRDAVDAEARSDEVAIARADLDLAVARAAELQAAYERTFLRSPVAGIVLRKYRRAGEMVSENVETPIVSVGDDRVLRVRAEVDEADIAPLVIGLPAYVKAPAYGETRFPGRVVRIGSMMGRKAIRTDQPAERTDTRVLEVLIDLDAGTHLPVGLRVDTFIVTSVGDAANPGKN